MVAGGAVGVVLVPVDASDVVRVVVEGHVQGALQALLVQSGHQAALTHAALLLLGADEGTLVVVLCLIVVV